MQQPANQRGAQAVVLVQGMPTDTQNGFRNMKERFARLLIILGAAHIVIGILYIFFQIAIYVALAFGFRFRDDAISLGALVIVTGTFGIRGGKKKGRCQVVTFNILSILSAVYDAYKLAVFAIYVNDFTPVYSSGYNANPSMDAGLAIYAVLIVLAIIELFVAICSSVVCCYIGACYDDCGPACCCPREPQYNQLVNNDQLALAQQQCNIGNQQQEMFNLNQQQAVFNPNQQQGIFNPNQQQLMFFPYQPMAVLNSQQPGAQIIPHQPNVLLIPNQPAFSALSPGATGQGPQNGQCTGLTTAPLSAEKKTQQGGEEKSCENHIDVDNTLLFAHDYDDDLEYHY